VKFMVPPVQATSRKPSKLLTILAIGLGIVLLLLIVGYHAKGNKPRQSGNLIASTRVKVITRGATPVAPVSKVSSSDGMVLMYIPAGEFIMGEDGGYSNSPQHVIYLDAFWIDQTEVTIAMYAKCVQAGKCNLVQNGPTDNHFNDPAFADHPVIYVTWFDAVSYCQWVGRRLLTEAEWEKAARGTDGRFFPWGFASPGISLLNFNNLVGDTSPVGSYPLGASPYGVFDLAGNVREWVADWFRTNYYKHSPSQNPQGPAAGEERVLRGGAFNDPPNGVRVTTRFSHVPDSPGMNRGFRCASSP
jgi:formylglycine-generating enzyme required for sulfatase activity